MRCLAGSLLLLALAAAPVPAAAQQICTVSDPTGTPLNVRATPGGEILGTIGNGRRIEIVDQRADGRGRDWALIRDPSTGAALGWVFRVFVACPR